MLCTRWEASGDTVGENGAGDLVSSFLTFCAVTESYFFFFFLIKIFSTSPIEKNEESYKDSKVEGKGNLHVGQINLFKGSHHLLLLLLPTLVCSLFNLVQLKPCLGVYVQFYSN